MSALNGAAQPEPTADCSTPGCDKAGTMACPTCIKLGLPPSRYCSQVVEIGLVKARRGALVVGRSPHGYWCPCGEYLRRTYTTRSLPAARML